MTEKEVENLILEYLWNKGIHAWKNQSTGIYDPTRKVFRSRNKFQINGVSDILGCLNDGRFLAIEIKKPVKNPRTDERLFNLASEDQRKFINNVNKNGGLAFVADSLSVVIDKLK
jgi:hypothetical protein